MAIRDLTVKERILLHLFDYNRYAEDYEVPLEVTQSGIAKAVGIRVQHVTQYVKPLVSEALVEQSTRHITRQPRRRKVYFLTVKGRHTVASKRTSLLNEAVQLKTRAGEVEETLFAKVYQEERRGSNIVELLTELSTNGYIAQIGDTSDLSVVDFTQEAPVLEQFYGREGELEAVEEALDRVPLVVVTGIPGIGKTTFGSKICDGVRATRSVFWRRVRPWDRATDLARSVAGFLMAMGRFGLHGYLASQGPKELTRMENLLLSDLGGVDALLVLDDIHLASQDARNFLTILYEVLKRRGTGTSALLLSRVVPAVYSRREVLEGSVAEFALRGLKREECRSLLADAGVPDSRFDQLIEVSAGSPLFLRFLANVSPRGDVAMGSHTVETYIAEEILTALHEEERACLQVASFYEIPVPPGGLLLERGGGTETLIGLQRRGLLEQLGSDMWVAHDLVRSFFQRGLPEGRREALLKKVVPWMLKEAERRAGRKDHEGAIAIMENAVAIETDQGRMPRTLERLAKLRSFAGDLSGAIEAYRTAIRNGPGPREKARLHGLIADVLTWLGRFREAEKEVERGLELVSTEPSLEAAWFHYVKAYIAVFLGDSEGALKEVEKVFNWLPDMQQNPELMGRAAVVRGIIHLEDSERRDLALALNDFRLAADLFKPLGNEILLVWALNNAAGAAFSLGRADEAARYHKEAVTVAEESGSLTSLLDALFSKAEFLLQRGEFRSAEGLLEETLRMSKPLDPDKWLLWHYPFFAGLYYWEGHMEEARESLDYFLKMSDFVAESVTPEQLIGTLSFMVRLCLLSNSWDLARPHLAQAEDVAQRTPSEAATRGVEWARGLLHVSQNQVDEAETSFLRALETSPSWQTSQDYATRNSPHAYRSGLLLDYGLLLTQSGKEQRAREVLLQARDELEFPLQPLQTAIEAALQSLGPG